MYEIELLDTFNIVDKVIYRETKSTVHKLRLFARELIFYSNWKGRISEKP